MADREHEHGKMDISDQEKTFGGFVRAATWTAAGIVVLLVLLYAVAG
jgi:hypothetical protein